MPAEPVEELSVPWTRRKLTFWARGIPGPDDLRAWFTQFVLKWTLDSHPTLAPRRNNPDRTWPLLWRNMLAFSNNGWWMPGIICAVTTIGIRRMESSIHSVNNHEFSTNWLLERPKECRNASAIFAPSQAQSVKTETSHCSRRVSHTRAQGQWL